MSGRPSTMASQRWLGEDKLVHATEQSGRGEGEDVADEARVDTAAVQGGAAGFACRLKAARTFSVRRRIGGPDRGDRSTRSAGERTSPQILARFRPFRGELVLSAHLDHVTVLAFGTQGLSNPKIAALV